MTSSRAEPSVAEQLAERIAALDPEVIPESVRRKCEDLFIDVIGLCIAARQSDYIASALAACDDDGRCTVIGQARRLSAAGAAFVNGTAAHGEDFDDTFEGGPVHAGAVIVPAVLAACERHARSGAAALLGRAGFFGPRTVFEGVHGLFNGFAHARGGDYAALVGDFGKRWVLETLAFKPYPCGTMIHPYIDCARRLNARGVPPG